MIKHLNVKDDTIQAYLGKSSGHLLILGYFVPPGKVFLSMTNIENNTVKD